ncbi:hypothetical protein [Maribacter luteus]|uniref:hypothetical protein n=1 Tax=Maribacter luteus TaxID=2594478 RepID=UPI002490F48C|nr:hypothetical protein [Maribacter luteus]
MKIETTKILSSFIFKHIDSKEFEEWIYSNENLEDELGNELYLELVSINFKDKDAYSKVIDLLEDRINLGSLHKSEIIELINQIDKKTIHPLKGISKLHRLAELGYLFLGRIDLIGNFGEQGKSLVHILDASMDKESQWSKLNQIDSNFIVDLKVIKNKLENGSIKLTGESETYQFIGKQYKFKE